MAYIYQIQNDINQKIYIGKTEFSIEKRFKEHCKDALCEQKENRPLYAAMRKYGIEHFHISLIEETNCPEERERYWIETLGSFKNGYNATLGGDGKKYLDYQLIMDTYLKIKNIKETARLLNIDRHHVSKILKENDIQIYTTNEINKKPVVQIDLNTGELLKIYPSIAEAEKEVPTGKHISSVCKGKRKSAGGYGWKFLSKI